MITPKCCEYAKTYVVLTYKYHEADFDDKAWFDNNKPHWVVRGTEADMDYIIQTNHDNRCPKEIHFCPHCGMKLPEIVKKTNPPKKIRVISDGGYYCDTCGKRLMLCECHRQEEMWETKE